MLFMKAAFFAGVGGDIAAGLAHKGSKVHFLGAIVFHGLDMAAIRGERLVFSGVNFTLGAGEAMLLVGPNGSGKSTLMRILAGLGRLAGGQLIWNGDDALADRTTHAGRVAYLGHQDAVKHGLTVGENLQVWGDPAPGLVAMDLERLIDMPGRILSAGQKRRLALARLAINPAPIWLLDEPTLGLDTASVARLGHVLAAHRERGGMVVAATHLPLPLQDVRELALP